MTPQVQTIFSDKSKGIFGNCLSACLATLTDMPVNYVPYFRGMNNPEPAIREYLSKHNMNFDGYKYDLPNDWGTKFAGVDGYVIVGGPSPRYQNQTHAVIYKYGQPFFDPHPQSNFLKDGKINRIYLITKK
jgi:hypothetical protein